LRLRPAITVKGHGIRLNSFLAWGQINSWDDFRGMSIRIYVPAQEPEKFHQGAKVGHSGTSSKTSHKGTSGPLGSAGFNFRMARHRSRTFGEFHGACIKATFRWQNRLVVPDFQHLTRTWTRKGKIVSWPSTRLAILRFRPSGHERAPARPIHRLPRPSMSASIRSPLAPRPRRPEAQRGTIEAPHD